jgi:flavin reductase (DIM6/NTAB) family NADH-FMN oxidoreductase RutF/uncharacterized membrane protein YhaH (DUF805 family)
MARKKSVWKYFLSTLRKYIVFKGRAGKDEYWSFILFYFIFYNLARIIDILVFQLKTILEERTITFSFYFSSSGFFYYIFDPFFNFTPYKLFSLTVALALIIPGLAVTVRRCHDIGKSAWNCFNPVFIPLILFGESTPATNQFGKNPKIEQNAQLTTMKQITMAEALSKTSPHPVSLICTKTPSGITNLAPVSWWTYLENDPPMMGFSMWKESYTCELAANTGKVVICIPGDTIAEKVRQCGNVSGRDVNKAKEFNIKLVQAPVEYPEHSKLAFLCTVENKVDVGECTFFICKIDEILCNENELQLFAWAGSEKLAPIPFA